MYDTKLKYITVTSNASMIDFWKQETDVICIKGVSDDKDKYLQFKNVYL
jgi:hypothetical protein